jgi:hypothetical protein
VANVDSKIDRYLKRLRLPDAEINIVPLMNKDSLEITDADRLFLLGMVRAILKRDRSDSRYPRHGHHGPERTVSPARFARPTGPDRDDRSHDAAGL